MHIFTSHRERTPRVFAHFDTPDNPICWLKGHTPRGKVVEPQYIEPYLVIDCRICGHRYSEVIAGLQMDDAREIANRRLINFQNSPKKFVHNIPKRGSGWGTGKLEFSFEAHAPRKPRAEFAASIRVGNQSSEQPYKLHVSLAGYGVWFGIGGTVGRAANFIGRGHKRELSLSMYNGSLWWNGWYNNDMGYDDHHKHDKWAKPKIWPWSMGRHKYRSWMCLREGSIDLNPLNAFYGTPKREVIYTSEKVSAAVEVNQFHADEYAVNFNVELREVRREFGPRFARRLIQVDREISWEAYDIGGIPVMNHDWKGDEILASGFSVPDDLDIYDESVWVPWAVERLLERVKSDRVRYNYHPPQPVEST